jgi:hypothetical protein
MRTLTIIGGSFLLVLAVAFALRIPTHWHSADPKALSKIGADIFFVLLLSASGLAILWKSRIDKSG